MHKSSLATIFTVATSVFIASASLVQAASTHYWTGGSLSSGNWGTAMNWQNSDAPEANGTEGLVFGANKARLQNTNNILPLAPASFVSYSNLEIRGGGYELHGNPIETSRITAEYPAGNSSTVYFDLLHTLTVVVSTNNSTLTLAGDLSLPTNATAIVGGLGDCIIKGIISGPGGVTKSQGSYGELQFSGFGANTYTGDTQVQDGLLRLNRYRLIGTTPAGATAVPGKLIIGTGTNSAAGDFVVLERDNQIANTSSVIVNGSGQLDLSGCSDTINSVQLNGGSVVTGNGNLTVEQWVSATAASGPSVIAGKLTFGMSDTHSLTAYPGARLEIIANIYCPTMVEKRYGGDLWLAASNQIAGEFTITEGTVIAAHPLALGFSSNHTVLNDDLLLAEPATLALENVTVSNKILRVSQPIARLRGAGNCGWAGEIRLAGAKDFVAEAAAGAVLTLNGIIDGSQRRFVKQGAGTIVLSGSQTDNLKTISVSQGRLRLNKTAGYNALTSDIVLPNSGGGPESNILELYADEQIDNAKNIEVLETGFFSVGDQTETIRLLTGNGAVSFSSGWLIISNISEGTFSGRIRGGREGFAGADVTKDGPGTWTLASSNTYWGKTYVQGGTLIINGTLTHSPVVISPAGALGGTGVVQTVSFAGAGGKIAPGAPIGALLAQGSVALTGGTLEVDLSGLTPGNGYDQLACAVAPALGSGSALNVTVGFVPPIGSQFIIVDNRSGAPVSGTFSGKPQAAKFAAGGLLFQISYTGGTGNDVVLTRVAAPAVSGFAASLAGGQVQLQAQGLTGMPYVLETTPTLRVPVVWQPIRTNTASESGLVQFVDPDLSVNPQRFYRIVSP